LPHASRGRSSVDRPEGRATRRRDGRHPPAPTALAGPPRTVRAGARGGCRPRARRRLPPSRLARVAV